MPKLFTIFESRPVKKNVAPAFLSLMQAVRNNDAEAVTKILIDATDKQSLLLSERHKALCEAVRTGKTEISRILLSVACDQTRRTLLMDNESEILNLAVISGSDGTVDVLLDAAPNKKIRQAMLLAGNSKALVTAALSGCARIVSSLLSAASETNKLVMLETGQYEAMREAVKHWFVGNRERFISEECPFDSSSKYNFVVTIKELLLHAFLLNNESRVYHHLLNQLPEKYRALYAEAVAKEYQPIQEAYRALEECVNKDLVSLVCDFDCRLEKHRFFAVTALSEKAQEDHEREPLISIGH